jgi:hypothetical protein
MSTGTPNAVINDATDFWQAIMDTGYLMEGENRAFERHRMKYLSKWLDQWFEAHPEIKVDGPNIEHFAMHAARRLVYAFVFNDEIGADRPDFRGRLRETVMQAVGADKLAEKPDMQEEDDL